jgi:hypothetical protein
MAYAPPLQTQSTPQPQAQQQPQQQGGYNPLQPVYAGASVDPTTTLNMILQGFQPQAQSARSALQNQLAAAGIVGGGAIGAESALERQLGASLAPTLGQAVQSSQGMTLEQALANAGFANQAGSQLAGYLQQGWQLPLQMFGQLQQQGLGTAGSLAGEEARNFPVYQQSPIWGLAGSALGGALGGPMGAGLGSGLGQMFGGGGASTAGSGPSGQWASV